MAKSPNRIFLASLSLVSRSSCKYSCLAFLASSSSSEESSLSFCESYSLSESRISSEPVRSPPMMFYCLLLFIAYAVPFGQRDCSIEPPAPSIFFMMRLLLLSFRFFFWASTMPWPMTLSLTLE